MQDVAPRAVSMADATDAMICTTHFNVSFFVIRFSILMVKVTDSIFLARIPRIHTALFIQLSGARSPRVWRSSWVWRQSTVACDFTLGPDPSNHLQ